MEERVADCPLGAKCEEVKHENGKPILYRCPWYVKVRGIDNNTGEELDHWNCAIAWMPTLAINTANEARKGAAATEDFRNRMVDQQAGAHHAVAALLQRAYKSGSHEDQHTYLLDERRENASDDNQG
jgi:hypothetical protein